MGYKSRIFIIFGSVFLFVSFFLLLFSLLHLQGVKKLLKEHLIAQGNLAADHYRLTSRLPGDYPFIRESQGFFIFTRRTGNIALARNVNYTETPGVFTNTLTFPDGNEQDCLVYLNQIEDGDVYLGSYISLKKIRNLYFRYFGIFSGMFFAVLALSGSVFIRRGRFGIPLPVWRMEDNEISVSGSPASDDEIEGDETAWWLEREIREHKRDVERLKETQQTLRTLIGNLPGIIYRSLDAEKKNLLYISSGVRELAGYDPDELIYIKKVMWKNRIPREEWDLIQDEIAEAVQNKRKFRIDYTYVSKEGARKKFLEHGQPVYNHDGRLRYIEGFIFDITAQKKIEEALLESNKNLATTLTSIGDGVVVTDENGIIGKINPAAEEIAGINSRDVLGRPFNEVFSFLLLGGGIPCDPVVEVQQSRAIYEEEGYILLTTRRGKKRYVSLTAAPIRGSSGIVIVVKDQTFRYQIESALQASNERFKTLFEFAPDGLALVDYQSGRYLEGNRKLLSLFGVTREELSDCTVGDFSVPPPGVKKNSLVRQILNILDSVDMQEEVLLGEWMIRSRHGEKIECEARVVKFLEGSRTFLRFSLLDIRERKKAQRDEKLKEEKLLQADKLASLGQLAAGIAHEISQPLSGISMTAEYLIYNPDEPEEKDQMKDRMYTILRYIDRIRSIISHVRMFSREQSAAPHTVFSANEAVTNSHSLVNNQYRKFGITIEMDLDMELPPIVGNVYRLEQVIINLISNAKDAIEESGRESGKLIAVRTYHDTKWVYIDIRDNGVGIPPEVMEKIFDPFYTTKGVQEGTGLGLSIVQGILREMNGDLSIESVPGEYTLMRLKFPAQPRK
ncbi:MAG: PAS domain S-box protein [Spirochaetia bacterium]